MSTSFVDFSSSIPGESLALAFSFLQVTDPVARASRRREPTASLPQQAASQACNPALGWIRVTFVCRRWRYVAIDEATLWTRLTNALGPEWLDVFLMRSRGALLNADDDDFRSDKTNDALHNLVLSHHARFSHLQLSSLQRWTKALEDILTLPFDSLELFALRMPNVRKMSSLRSLQLFKGHAPRLRRVLLEHPGIPFSGIDWTTPVLDRLTFLQLTLNVQNSPFVTSTFLDALSRMKQLSYLHISETPNHRTQFACGKFCSDAAQVVHLERLETLTLSGTLESHAHFLHHTRLSMRASLTLGNMRHLDVPPPDEEAYDAFRDGVNAVWPRSQVQASFQAACMTFNVRRGSEYDIELELTRDNSPIHSFHPGAVVVDQAARSNPLRIHMRHDGIAVEIFLRLPLKAVRSLFIEGGGMDSDVGVLRAFTSVEHFLIAPSDSPHEASAITRFLSRRAALPGLILPKLQRLSAPVFKLSEALTDLAPGGGLDGTFSQGDLLQRLNRVEYQYGLYLHIQEEVALVRGGRIGETSCVGIEEARVIGAIERLEAWSFVRIVGKNFDVFAIQDMPS
ncbi:hypothetical protein PENSPDRAFT_646546 [Peniophora sp. CONT]|nr:hypothetical protein PENSPDRAFT_646546 [Peniophora sp. CONT]